MQAWTPLEQRARPIHRTAGGGFAAALAALIEASGAGSGIRPRN